MRGGCSFVLAVTPTCGLPSYAPSAYHWGIITSQMHSLKGDLSWSAHIQQPPSFSWVQCARVAVKESKLTASAARSLLGIEYVNFIVNSTWFSWILQCSSPIAMQNILLRRARVFEQILTTARSIAESVSSYSISDTRRKWQTKNVLSRNHCRLLNKECVQCI